MTFALGHAIYAMAVVVVFIGFLLKGNLSAGVLNLVVGGLWVAAVARYPKRWLFNIGVMMMVALLLLAGLSLVMIWWLLLALVLALMGDELLRFQFKYKDMEISDTMLTGHLVQTSMVGIAALALSGLALSFQLSLAFWPVLGLGIVALLAIIFVLRRLRTTSEN